MKPEKRTGWGRALSADNHCYEISEFAKLKTSSANASGLAIGLGRSYGDSSLNSEGIHWSCGIHSKIAIEKIEDSFVADCGAGVTIGELERAAINAGLFPLVVPGTEFVTIGGAIASNIHGKSHHSSGSFGDQIYEISLLGSRGIHHKLSPNDSTSELFWATVGGMGLTGVILSAKIKLSVIQTSYIATKEKRVESLEELLKTLEEFDSQYLYTVAWIDLSGKFRGRGVVSGGNHAKIVELPNRLLREPLAVKLPNGFTLPDIFPSTTINKLTVRLFNAFWFRKPLKNNVVHIRQFLHPLDSIRNWNRIYGRNGLTQYQVQIPLGQENYIEVVLQEMRRIGVASFLGVIKRFGPCREEFLSFPSEGWTLAVDIPAGHKGLEASLDFLDEKLCEVGGKIYLAKDSRVSEHHFQRMYPKLSEWKVLKKKIDPENYWQSDQGRRLKLC